MKIRTSASHLSLAAALAVMAAACAPQSDSIPDSVKASAAPARPVSAQDFEAQIARLEQRDPQSPEALSARLQYADFLVEGTEVEGTEVKGIGGDCGKRLDGAQAQLDAASARPALDVLLPLGRARVANGEYKIHIARAACVTDPDRRKAELDQALDAARKAGGLYRDGFDYQSAVVMQFNVAAAEHELGDGDAGLAALDAAIAMDREYGFRDDAQDNYKLWLRWKKQDDSDAAVASLMKDFPARSANLKFDWLDSDADVAVVAEDTNLVTGGKVIHSRGAIVLKRHVSRDFGGTNITYEPGTPTIEAGDWTGQNDILRQFTAYLLGSALLGHPNFEVHRNGDFEYVHGARDFGEALSTQVTALLGTPRPADAEPALVNQTGPSRPLAHDLKSVFSAQKVVTDAVQSFNIETATWAGATLQQGVWYEMSAPLLLPGLGMGQFQVTHEIEFAFTRQLPCTPGTTGPLCVEIVLRATPDANELKLARELVTRALQMPDPNALRYWSTASLRFVVKPDTLVPYVRDTRRNWYIAIDGTLKDDPAISSESVVATSTYR
jgi:hypothetical protein